MRLGILLCGEHYPETIKEFGFYDDDYKRILDKSPIDEYLTYRCYLNEFPIDENCCDAFLISGSKFSVYDDYNWIKNLVSIIRKIAKSDKKLSGFCFGHQIIHHALGGRVIKSPKGWGLGLYPVEIQMNYHNFKKGDRIEILAMHQDQVVEMAKGFQKIAGSDFCPYSITQKDNKIFTIQSHPEFEVDFFTMLCAHIKDKAGDELVLEALSNVNKKGEGNRKQAIDFIKNFYEKKVISKEFITN